MNNWQESVAGTDPTNSASVLQMSIVCSNSKAIVSWPSVTNRGYYLYVGTYFLRDWYGFSQVRPTAPQSREPAELFP